LLTQVNNLSFYRLLCYDAHQDTTMGQQLIHGKIRIIGLTGGIATGKSTVGRFFAERGIPVIDADQLAREAVMPGAPAREQIVELFGREIVTQDGLLDRKQLGALVFSDPVKRRQLEAILHPEIRKLADERISRAAASGHQRVIYMAPLLIEAGATDRVDAVWVVTVRPEVQLERLMQRDGINREQAEQIIDSQMPLSEKERCGSVVIDNSGTEEQTREILETVWAEETGRSNE
jgi:dephospho-CoA kinase